MIVGFFQSKSKTVAVCGSQPRFIAAGEEPNAGRRTQKGETPSPVSISGSGIAAGLGRNVTARHRRNITAGRLCVAGPRRLRLSRRAETSVRAFMPVSWARLRQHVCHHGCGAPAARTAPLATGASNLAARWRPANGRAVWAAARAWRRSCCQRCQARAVGSHHQQAPDRFWPRSTRCSRSAGCSNPRPAAPPSSDIGRHGRTRSMSTISSRGFLFGIIGTQAVPRVGAARPREAGERMRATRRTTSLRTIARQCRSSCRRSPAMPSTTRATHARHACATVTSVLADGAAAIPRPTG